MSNSLPAGIQRGKKYRFMVKNAEEAIQTIKQRMGQEAKVLSVQQIDGKGLSRFLNAPKLEIIAWVPPVEEEKEPENTKEKVKQKPGTESRQFVLPEKDELDADMQITDSVEDELRSDLAEEISHARRPLPSELYLRSNVEQSNDDQKEFEKKDIWNVLSKSGFPESLLTSIRYSERGEKIRELPLSLALAEIHKDLRGRYHAIDKHKVTNTIAFLGTPGVGKTTAMCKRIANDVFLLQKNVHVLKIDCDTPNPDDELSVFCDVVGVPLHRDPIGMEDIPSFDTLYVDLPGAVLDEKKIWGGMRMRLDELSIDTRVLVVNAGYDADLLQAAFELGRNMRATHLVLTHLDELPKISKLWIYILKAGLTPLFVSKGQNVTSDYDEDILDILMKSTFPDALVRK